MSWRLTSNQNYHLSRIFRELCTNIIRHAGATAVEFEVQYDGEAWHFALLDNGRGFDILQTAGNGMRSLQARAVDLGATLQWIARSEGGVAVTLRLPGTGVIA